MRMTNNNDNILVVIIKYGIANIIMILAIRITNYDRNKISSYIIQLISYNYGDSFYNTITITMIT